MIEWLQSLTQDEQRALAILLGAIAFGCWWEIVQDAIRPRKDDNDPKD